MSKTAIKQWGSTLFGTIAVVLVAAVACGAAPGKDKAARNSKNKADAPLSPVTYDPRVSLAPLVQKVAPAVVNIRTTAKMRRMPNGTGDLFQWFFGPRGPGMNPFQQPHQRRTQRAVGSGFIIDKKGQVVTNHHVVKDADEIEIQLADDRKFKVELIGSDERTDVALLRIMGAKNLPFVSFGSSESLRVGDHVVAIGNPFGLDHTVTSGIVSAKEREIGAGMYDDFIQTDASINPGNSGGPLFNLKGKVIGINTAINPHGQGIGFAIPSDLATQIIDSLSGEGAVIRGYLGISFQPLDKELSKAFKVSEKGGVIATNVYKDSPADKGGMLPGDVIVEVGGKKLKKSRQLPSLVAKLKPGTATRVKVLRNGKAKTLKIKVGKMPDDFGTRSQQPKSQKEKSKLGIHVQALDNRTRQRLGARDIDGVVVTAVDSDSATGEALSPGDIITEVNREPVPSVESFGNKVGKAKKGDDLLFRVFRRGGWRYVVVRL